MITEEAIQFEEKIYDQLKIWREEKGWHFSLRKQLGKPTSARIFIGSMKSRYFGTTFWDMPGSVSHVNDTLNVFFSIKKKRGFVYTIEGRQSRKPDGNLAEAYVSLVEWLADGPHEFAKRAKINDTSRDVATVVVEGKQHGYDDLTSYIKDIEQDLATFIPLADQKLEELRNQYPEFSARRLTTSDTAEYEQRRTQLIARRNSQNSSETDFPSENEEVEYYIIGSKYGNTNANDVYPQFRDRSVVSVGFAWNRDLTDLYDNSPAENREILKAEGEEPASYNALRKFIAIKPGDYIAVKRSGSPKGSTANLEIAAIGVAEERDGEFYQHEPEALAHTIPVRWIATDLHDTYELGYGMTVHRLSQSEHIQAVFGKYVDDLTYNPAVPPRKFPLNQILYGPPGTGKTYRTISLAVQVANPAFDVAPDNRKAVRDEYRRLQAAGRIVFTTFHQSLAYEDFVEGLKPKLTEAEEENAEVAYEIKPGIFRKLSIEAMFSSAQELASQDTQEALSFSDKLIAFTKEVRSRIEDGNVYEVPSKLGRRLEIRQLSERDNFWVYHGRKGSTKHTISHSRLIKLNNALKDKEEVVSIDRDVQGAIGGSNTSAYYALWDAIRDFKPQSTASSAAKEYTFAEKAAVVQALPATAFKDGEPHVLIIDEINRGNVSRIFGELITLLEPDKRLGASEALTVTLPYSGEEFGVPPNLYVIGTMNTADRSVVALDSALRRRFSFVEVGPDPELLREVGNAGAIEVDGESFSLVELLKKINARIEFLLDRDHCIGHSYFFKVKGWESLRDTMTKKVMPLLQEYFYDDYGRIRLILGSGFVKCDKVQPTDLFPGKDDLVDELDDQVRYRLAKIHTEAQLADALQILVNGQGDE